MKSLVLAIVLSLSTMAFAADNYRNAVFNFNQSTAVDYSLGGITISSTTGTILGDPFVCQLPNGQDTTYATSGTILGDPFAIQNPQTNSTDMNGLLSYMSTQPFLVQTTGMYVSYNLIESTNNTSIGTSGNCSVLSASFEVVDNSNGQVLATITNLASFCTTTWSQGTNPSATYYIPDAWYGKTIYVRLHVTESSSVPYTSMGTSNMTYMGYTPYSTSGGTMLSKSLSPIVAGNATLLEQNYPNPVSTMTTITVSNINGPVSVKVYDVLGRQVADLSSSFPQSGTASVQFDATQLQNGIYFYKMQTADGTVSEHEMIVKR